MRSIVALPAINVAVMQRLLPPAVIGYLGEVTVRQRLSQPAQCELVFHDAPVSLNLAALLVPGAALRLSLDGWHEPLFVGEVTAVEHVYGPNHAHSMRVRGYDLMHRLRKHQDVRAHVQVNAYELAQEFVATLGLAVQAVEHGPLWQRLYQHQQSDLALLVDVAARCGLYFTLRDDVLHLVTLDGIGTALPLVLGETLLEARVEVNTDPACRTVTVSGWDPLRVEPHRGQATQPRVGRAVAAEANPMHVGSDGQRKLVDERTPTDDHATGLAQAELDRRLAGEVTLWGVAEGDPRLCPAARVAVDGLDPALSGRYVLTEVTHRIAAATGYVVELSTTPAPAANSPKGTVSTLGVITAIDDPQKLGRVRVTLPAYNNVESDWWGMLSVGAGAGKGLMMMPDVGDRVLVLLMHEDPGEGIVLGGLYGMQGFPDSGVENGVVRRYTLQTPGGQRIRLDDTNHAARLENSDGSYLELTPGKVRIHAATELEIEAPGRALVIRAQSIDFQQG
jgi:phage baseplate assembly protein gpV/phage protein D